MNKRKNAPWTEESLKELQAMLLSDMLLKDIAESWGLSTQRLYQITKRYRLSTKLRRGRAKRFESERENRLHKTFVALRHKAKQRGIEFSIRFEDLYPLPERCEALGVKLDYNGLNRNDFAPSFDKIHPEKGYIKGNVRIISWRANRIKSDGYAHEHRAIADYISRYH